LFREWSGADFPKLSKNFSVVSGMERSGFPETPSRVKMSKDFQLFREWSGADFPKLSKRNAVEGNNYEERKQ